MFNFLFPFGELGCTEHECIHICEREHKDVIFPLSDNSFFFITMICMFVFHRFFRFTLLLLSLLFLCPFTHRPKSAVQRNVTGTRKCMNKQWIGVGQAVNREKWKYERNHRKINGNTHRNITEDRYVYNI